MRFIPHSFNGFLFQQTTKVASDFDNYDWDIAGISTTNTARNGNRPKYSGKIYGGEVKVVNVTLNDVDCDRDALVIAMDVQGDQQHELYALDELGRKWYVMAICTGMNTETTEGKTAQFGYIFDVDDPTWVAVAEDSDTWNIAADGDLHTVTVGGNQNTRPVFEITPGLPITYYPYTQYVSNYNPIALAQWDAIDITNGGWNTAALVAGGKMLASGDDCRVIFDGAEIPRWVGGGGWNSATTKIFIAQAWSPGQSMRLKTALPAVGGTYIYWKITDAVKTALGKLPKSGSIRVGTEEISYRSLIVSKCRASIVERGIRDTTPAIHAINALCYWVEHDIKIIYGDAAADAPVYADTNKPVFTLATSTNSSRVYAEFADTANLRAGAWLRQVIYDGLGKLNRVYSGNQAAIPEVDPATDMGMEIASYAVQGRVKPETAELAWRLYHPAYIETVTTVGEKWRALAATSWPAAAELQSSTDGKIWVREWNEVTPAVAASWTVLANVAAEAVPAGTKFVRFRLSGSINALASNFVRMEIDSVTVALTAGNVIQVAMNGETASYQFNIEIANTTTGESIFLDYPCATGVPIVIDTEAMTITYRGINAIRAISWDSIRNDWLKFVPGPNILQFFADDVSTIDVLTKTHDKSL